MLAETPPREILRKIRFLATKLIPNKKSETVRNAILSTFEPFLQAVKSITLDNGTEFADHKIIAKRLNATVYFAHLHYPLEREFLQKTFLTVFKWPTAIYSLKAVPCSISLRNQGCLYLYMSR